MNFKYEVKLQDPALSFKDKVNQRAYLLPNFSNILLIGTDKSKATAEKCNISSNFHHELARCCNFPIKKQKAKGAPI